MKLFYILFLITIFSFPINAQGLLEEGDVPDPAKFERANYMKVLHSYK